MKIYQRFKYTQIVRVELKNLETKKIHYVSFCETTLEEVIKHVDSTLQIGVIGIKVRLLIRITDPVKKWGAGKTRIVFIKDIDKAIEQISANIPTMDINEIIE